MHTATSDPRKQINRCRTSNPGYHLLAVDPAQIAVPANSYYIRKEQTELERHNSKVDCLDSRPHHPVCLEGRPPRLLYALLSIGAFQLGHAAEKHANHDGCKNRLVDRDAGDCLDLLALENDPTSQKAVPERSDRPKDG